MWMSVVQPSKDANSQSNSAVSCNEEATTTKADGSDSSQCEQQQQERGRCDFMQINFVKSPLTVNPCLVGVRWRC